MMEAYWLVAKKDVDGHEELSKGQEGLMVLQWNIGVELGEWNNHRIDSYFGKCYGLRFW